jgi:pyroglutamyl-peptidase
MKTVLVTGFEPFGGETINPSWEAARALRGARVLGRRMEVLRLPVSFGRALSVLRRRRAALRPELTLCVGQAEGRTDAAVERVALNLADARAADEDGRRPREAPVARGGPAAYWARLPVRAVVAALRADGVPASESLSAGTFVCNQVFYGLMRDLEAEGAGALGGFLHLPLLPEQAARAPGRPSLPRALAVRAVRVTVETALRVSARRPAGRRRARSRR